MELVEDDERNAAELRVRLKLPQQDARSHDREPVRRRSPAFAADDITDPAADALAQQRRDAAGGGAHGNPARLKQEDSAVDRIEQRGRDQRGLARTRRGRKHGSGVRIERGNELRQDGTHRQIGVIRIIHFINIAGKKRDFHFAAELKPAERARFFISTGSLRASRRGSGRSGPGKAQRARRATGSRTRQPP